MAYASYLYRLARSCESLEGVGRCLSILGSPKSAVYLQRRLATTSDDASNITDRLEESKEGERRGSLGENSGILVCGAIAYSFAWAGGRWRSMAVSS